MIDAAQAKFLRSDDGIPNDRGVRCVWEAGLDEGYRRDWQDIVVPNNAGIDCTDAFAEGAEWGAGWMAALIGMAAAIRETCEARQRQADHEDRMLEADMGQ